MLEYYRNMMLPIIKCLKTYKARSSLNSHLRTCLRAEEGDLPFPCNHCPDAAPSAFSSIRGLQQHIRQAHSATYNSATELEAAEHEATHRNYNRWTLLEIEEMATHEAGYEGRNANVYLATLIKRPLDSIKMKRRTEHYKGVLLMKREKLLKKSQSRKSPPPPRTPGRITSPFLEQSPQLDQTSASFPSPPIVTIHTASPPLLDVCPGAAPGDVDDTLPARTPSPAGSERAEPFFGLRVDPVIEHIRTILLSEAVELSTSDRQLAAATINRDIGLNQ